MLFGAHPLLAYAIVGLGAAAYSPAKYGILTELLPTSQLVKANGWIEGLTILSIIFGVAARRPAARPRRLAAPARLRRADVRHRHRHRARGGDRGRSSRSTSSPRSSTCASRAPKRRCSRCRAASRVLVRDFSNCNARLWNDKLGQISLATTTLFWGVSGNLRVIVFAWAAAALGYSTTQASALVGVVAIGTAAGAIVASLRMRLDQATQRHPARHRHGDAGGRPQPHHRCLVRGAVPDPARRDRRLPGRADERPAAAPRRTT